MTERKKNRIVLPLLVICTSISVFILLLITIKHPSVITISILPIVVVGWFWGTWPAVITTVFFFIICQISMTKFHILTATPQEMIGGFMAFCAFLLVGIGIGKFSSLSKKLKTELELRTQLEETLRQNENYLMTIFNFIHAGIMIVDAKTHKIIDINPNFGKTNIGKKKTICIDFSAPNIGKPMHIGHIRSTILGDSLMRIYDFLNYKPIGINYLGDIGLHIGKLIVAWELWLDKEALKKEPVQELLRLYVKFCAEEKTFVNSREDASQKPLGVWDEGADAEEEFSNNSWTLKAKEKLRLLELGDKKAIKIWQDIQKASGKGFDKVYDMLNVKFTETTGQSNFSIKGKDIVMNALKNNLAKRDETGGVYTEFNLPGQKELQKKFILRSNQTASYITQDLGAAVDRNKTYKFDKMVYIVDFRQEGHFSALFTILKQLGYDFADKLIYNK